MDITLGLFCVRIIWPVEGTMMIASLVLVSFKKVLVAFRFIVTVCVDMFGSEEGVTVTTLYWSFAPIAVVVYYFSRLLTLGLKGMRISNSVVQLRDSCNSGLVGLRSFIVNQKNPGLPVFFSCSYTKAVTAHSLPESFLEIPQIVCIQLGLVVLNSNIELEKSRAVALHSWFKSNTIQSNEYCT